MDIYHSARRHGVSDADMRHAIAHAMYVGDQDEGLTLYLGPTETGLLLEIVTVRRVEATELVIHAMKMRAKYQPLLGSEDD